MLSETELACLRHLLDHEGSLAPHCSNATLENLVMHRLVEKLPALSLPVIPPRYSYRLTAAGRAALDEHRS